MAIVLPVRSWGVGVVDASVDFCFVFLHMFEVYDVGVYGIVVRGSGVWFGKAGLRFNFFIDRTGVKEE